MTDQPFAIGDEVDVRFDRSIVTDVQKSAGGHTLTVQTASAEVTFDLGANDTFVERTKR